MSAVYKKLTAPLDTADIHTILNSIIAGDLNAKNIDWNSSMANATENLLGRYINTRNDTTVAGSNSPIYYLDISTEALDILDIAIKKTSRL